jgi:hypothetical protein
MGFNAKADASGRDAGGQQFPLLHCQDHTKMRHGNVMAIHWIMRRNGSGIGIEMRDDLMSEKVEVDPVIRRAPFGAPHDVAVKTPRFG